MPEIPRQNGHAPPGGRHPLDGFDPKPECKRLLMNAPDRLQLTLAGLFGSGRRGEISLTHLGALSLDGTRRRAANAPASNLGCAERARKRKCCLKERANGNRPEGTYVRLSVLLHERQNNRGLRSP